MGGKAAEGCPAVRPAARGMLYPLAAAQVHAANHTPRMATRCKLFAPRPKSSFPATPLLLQRWPLRGRPAVAVELWRLVVAPRVLCYTASTFRAALRDHVASPETLLRCPVLDRMAGCPQQVVGTAGRVAAEAACRIAPAWHTACHTGGGGSVARCCCHGDPFLRAVAAGAARRREAATAAEGADALREEPRLLASVGLVEKPVRGVPSNPLRASV